MKRALTAVVLFSFLALGCTAKPVIVKQTTEQTGSYWGSEPATREGSLAPTAASQPVNGWIAGITFTDAGYGWLAQRTSLLVTEDGGRTWRNLYTHSAAIHNIALVSELMGWIVAEDGVYFTKDGGETWEQVILGGSVDGQVRFLDEQTWWVKKTDGTLGLTKDSGNSWSKVIQTPCPARGIFTFINEDLGWVVCGLGGGAGIEPKRLYRSGDGGMSWHVLAETGPLGGPPGTMPLGSAASSLFFLNETTGWLGTAKGGLMVTHDGGKSWSNLPYLGDLNDVARIQFTSPENGFVVIMKRPEMQSELLSTSDGGKAWTTLYPTNSK